MDGNKSLCIIIAPDWINLIPMRQFPGERITRKWMGGKEFVGMQIFDKFNLLALVGDDGVYVMDLNTLNYYIIDIPFGLNYIMNEN